MNNNVDKLLDSAQLAISNAEAAILTDTERRQLLKAIAKSLTAIALMLNDHWNYKVTLEPITTLRKEKQKDG